MLLQYERGGKVFGEVKWGKMIEMALCERKFMGLKGVIN